MQARSKPGLADNLETMAKPNGIIYSSPKSPQHPKIYAKTQAIEHGKQSNHYLSMLRLKLSNKGFWRAYRRPSEYVATRGSSLWCHSAETRHAETEECVREYRDSSDTSRYELLNGEFSIN